MTKFNFMAIVNKKIPMIAADDVPKGAVVRVYNILPSFNGGAATAYFWWGNQRGYCPLDLLKEI